MTQSVVSCYTKELLRDIDLYNKVVQEILANKQNKPLMIGILNFAITKQPLPKYQRPPEYDTSLSAPPSYHGGKRRKQRYSRRRKSRRTAGRKSRRTLRRTLKRKSYR